MIDPITIASLALSAGTGIYGAVQAGQERKKMDKYFGQLQSENDNTFNKKYYQNYLDRADTQYLINSMKNQLKERSDIAKSTSVITGATHAQQLAQQEADNKSISDMYGRIGAIGQQEKDTAEARYLQRKGQLQGLQYQRMGEKAQSYENLMSNAIGSTGNLVTGLASTTLNKPDAISGNVGSAMKTDTPYKDK